METLNCLYVLYVNGACEVIKYKVGMIRDGWIEHLLQDDSLTEHIHLSSLINVYLKLLNA